MGKQYQIDIVADDHGAVDVFKRVETAGSSMATSVEKGTAAFQKMPEVVKATTAEVTKAAQSWDTYVVSAKEAEDVLQALGNTSGGKLSQLRGGLNEVATAAGINVEQLGLMNAAGLVIGTAYAAWGIGRMIADFFDLDTKIGKATASLLGWGDVSKETNLAVQASIDLATQRGAHLEMLTSQEEKYAAAIKFNAGYIENQNAAYKFLLNSEAAWQAELDKHAASLPGLKRDLDLHVLSINELAVKYGIGQHAIELYRHELKETEDQEKRTLQIRKQVATETNRAYAEQEKELNALYKAVVALGDDEFKRRLEVNKAITAEFQKQLDFLTKQMNTQVTSELNAKIANQKAKGYDVAGNALDSPNAIGGAADVLARTMAELNEQRAKGVQTAAREEAAINQYLAAVNKVPPATDQMVGSHNNARTAADGLASAHGRASSAVDATAAALGKFTAGIGYQMPSGESLDRAGIIASTITHGPGPGSAPLPWGGGKPPIQQYGGSRDSGGPVQAGSAYYVGRGAQPELFVPSSNGMMVPNGAGGQTINHISIDARGATFEDDRALDRLTTKVVTRIGARASKA